MELYIIMGLAAIIIALAVVILVKLSAKSGSREDDSLLRKEINDTVNTSVKNLGDMIGQNQRTSADSTAALLKQLEERIKTLEANNEAKLESMRKTINERLDLIREDNNRELDKIRGTVDEKLQKTLDEKLATSFKQVAEHLEQVQKGIGEMQTMAANVGDLKKVLSGVKTRGILGEIQLGAILSEILAPEQYAEDIAIVNGSANRVEYAVKLPGEDGNTVWLPIDSKFPMDAYSNLQDAYDSGEADKINSALSTLITRIKSEAKDIQDKYIYPPDTTNFGILFLPFEGLYAEVVNRGLVEELQSKYKVNVAGPSTMAALLNSLQMGFRTLAIQKRSAEVWQILGAVKTEFGKYSELLSKTKERLRRAENDIDDLLTTRTGAINRKLREVETLDTVTAAGLLGTGTDEE